MDSATIDQYLQKLEELIYDEDKIVTCVLLAELLEISIQDSKQLLAKFVEDQRQTKQKELSVTHLLSGVPKGDSFPAVRLVKEDDLEKKRSEFDKVICELLYSVQKANNIDFNIIAQVEKSNPENPRKQSLVGTIVSKNCVKRTLRPRALPTLPPPKQNVKQKPSSFFTKIEPKNIPKTEIKNEKEHESKTINESNNKPKQENKAKNKGGITNFFTKGASKPAESSNKSIKKENVIEEKQSNEKENKVDSNGIERDETNSTKQPDPPLEKIEEMEVDVENDESEKIEIKKKTTQTSAKKNKKKRLNKENNDQPNKRRKRIVQRDDSDSDDMFGGDEDNYDDIIEKSIVEESEPAPVRKPPLAPKNKIRKAVDRTYEDEDGYIVTRTEYVYETPSEDENEEVIKAPQNPPSTPASEEKKKPNSSIDDTSPGTKGSKGKKGKKAPAANQPSIMNFFKKK